MKETALTNWHSNNGARMVEFAGFSMPIQYDGIKSEHLRVRESAGIFDVSHMGNFFINGKDAAEFINKVIVGNPVTLLPGKVLYSLFCMENGAAVDDLLVYKISANEFMLVVNASNIEKDYNWLLKNSEGYKINFENKSESWSILAVQGPESISIAEKVFNKIGISSMESYAFLQTKLDGTDLYISTTGYTGEIGIEIYCPKEQTLNIWEKFIEFGIKPSGLAARDTLRLEKGFSLYGHELNDTINIIDAGLKWTIDFNTDFIGKSAITPENYNASLKTLGLLVKEKGIPREGAEILLDGKKVGVVTSGTMSPSLNKGIAIVMVDSSLKPGMDVEVSLRGKSIPAILSKRKMV